MNNIQLLVRGCGLKERNLRFLNSLDNVSIPFLPYGVTSIEFTLAGKCKPGYIRPANSTLNNPKSKEYVGFAENTNRDFLVVWGAGCEKGQRVKENSTDRMFMQLIHLEGSHTEATIMFEHSELFNRKALKIHTPENTPPMSEIFRMVTEGNDANFTTKRLEGTYLPTYYSRWFPPKEIEFVKPAIYPQIRVKYKEDKSGIISPIEVFSGAQRQNKKICEVEGDLRYSRLHAELFAMFRNKNIFVLRLWLYWIHKNFAEGLLGASVGSIEDEGKDQLGMFDRASGLEIPDIERFDFVINADDNKIIFYGSDIHYQEYWGTIEDHLVKAIIARNIDLITKTGELFPLRFRQECDYYNPIEAVKASVFSKNKKTSESIEPIQKKPEELEKLGLGDFRAHVPYVQQGMIGGKSFLSSDSRRGANL
jgi:hypothetical protein